MPMQTYVFTHWDGPVVVVKAYDQEGALLGLMEGVTKKWPNQFSTKVEDYRNDLEEGNWEMRSTETDDVLVVDPFADESKEE